MIDMEIHLINPGITADGHKRWQKTGAYQQKVSEIKRKVRAEYEEELSTEKKWHRRLILILKRDRDVKKQIAALGSEKNLHLGGRSSQNKPLLKTYL